MNKQLTPKARRGMKNAYVEVRCGTPHSSIYIPNRGWKCRYARGFVIHQESGLLIKKHDCHWCNGYWLLPALTPKDKRICSNCGGPAVPTGEPSCWPDLFIVEDFVD
jgi:hypothetical protein